MSRYASLTGDGRRSRWPVALAAVALIGSGVAAVSLAAPASAIPAGITGYHVVMGAETVIADNGTASTDVSCPSGQTAVSAGVVAHNPLTFVQGLQPTSATTWHVTMTNTAVTGYGEHFHAEVVCVDTSSVPGFHTAENDNVSVSAGTSNASDAYCLSTEYAIGGGEVGQYANEYASILRPTDDTQGWQADVYNASALNGTFTVYASCIPKTDVSAYQVNTSLYNPDPTAPTNLTLPVPGSATAKTNTASAPYCTADQVAVGGGTANHDNTNGYISSTYPSTDNRSWLATSTDVNPPNYVEHSEPNVVCVNGTVQPTIIATTTTLTVNPPSPALNQTAALTATVTPQSGTGTPTGTVTFFDNGTPIGTSTLMGGVATLSTTFGGGAHSLTASYSGDVNYGPSTSAPVTFTIACTSTITGTHGAVAATSGLTCVSGAHITGGISVGRGATLDLEGSTVSGSISANAPAGIRICGSTTSSIAVTSATGFVRIGDPSMNCAGNVVTGSILAANNTGGGTIAGNTVSGSVTAVNNTPAFTVTGNHH